jgi:hypothetical protein
MLLFKNGSYERLSTAIDLALQAGLEPATYGLTVRRSTD